MTIQEYLEQAKYLERKISIRQKELDRLRALSKSAPTTSVSIGSHNNMPSDRVGDITIRIVMAENTINNEIDEYVDIKSNIKKILSLLPDINEPPRTREKIVDIFDMRYVNFEKWEQIATIIDCTYQWVNMLHLRGIKYLEKRITIVDSNLCIDNDII